MSQHVTREILDETERYAEWFLVHWAETGHPPFTEGSGLTLDEARGTLREYVERRRESLIGISVGTAMDFVRGAVEDDLSSHEAVVSRMDEKAVLADVESLTEDMERLAAEATAARDALLELRQVAHRAARGALAAGLTAALSSAAGFPQPPTSPRVVGGAVAGE